MTNALILENFDPAVRPQDDLYRHVNGRWLSSTEIPSDKPIWGSFTILRENAQEAVKDIITSLEPGAPQGSVEQKIADLYASFMDTERIESLGGGVLAPFLARVKETHDVEGLVDLLGWLTGHGFGSLFGFDVDADPGEPANYIVFAGQSGIGLPNEEYYRADEHAETRAKYVAHIENSLALAGWHEPAAAAQAIMELETAIASHHWDKVRCRDLQQMYNPQSFDELCAAAPQLQLPRYFAAADLAAPTKVVNCQPSYFEQVQHLLTEGRLSAWKSWAAWRIISGLSMFLSEDFVNERFGFVGTVLSGTPEIKERWRRGVELVEGCLDEAIGEVYVQRHFSPSAKARMDALVENLLEAYRRSITDLEWMTDETKAQAHDKLSKFRTKIGHPDTYRDYSALTIDPSDLVGNVMRSRRADTEFHYGKAGQEVDRDEWLMSPQTVNAYYHPLRNEIVFPAAILQPPFFSEDADDAVNYGGIGAVIGHEIGHGFDDQGSTCDGDGLLRDWWTQADRDAFTERTKALIGQYDALSPAEAPDAHVNGELTIGENIGDLGGLGIAIKAYQIATEGTDVPEIDGFTGIQRLFYSWATVWQTLIREEACRTRLATDPHSPNEFRCNQIVRNLPEFYEAFEVTEADQLWLAEDQRVKIW